MVYYTGDIHGQRYEIERFCKRFKPTRDDTIVILGDVGANYSLDERDAELKEALDKLKPTSSASTAITKSDPGTSQHINLRNGTAAPYGTRKHIRPYYLPKTERYTI